MKRTSLKYFLTIILALAVAAGASAQSNKKGQNKKSTNKGRVTTTTTKKPQTTHTVDTVTLAKANEWADKKMKNMTLEQKVGQLMFVRVPTRMSKKQKREFDKNFTQYEVGGLCFFRGTSAHQLEQTKTYQRMSHIPLMVTIDGEWGLGMRLTDCYSFPRAMMMGALTPANDTLIGKFGEEVGNQCKKMGIHVNFAPVADINCNPNNPVIGTRSFGENPKRVARKAMIYAVSMQKKGIIAVGKHFPGHGDTDADSHLDLPLIKHTKGYIDTVDIFPFRRLINNGIRGIMVAHLQVNAYDNRTNMPSSLSEKIVEALLRKVLQFDGLIFTDGIDMKAVSKNYNNGDGAIRAIRAGNDVILLPIDVEKTVKAVIAEAKKDPAFAKMIDDRCHRILREKYISGLNEMNLDKLSVPTKKDSDRCRLITQSIAEKAMTLVKNDDALPLEQNQKVINIAVGNCDSAVTYLDSALAASIREAGTVVISLYGNVSTANNFGISSETVKLVNDIADLDSVSSILVIYGSPYLLASFPQPLPTNLSTTANAVNAANNTVKAYRKGPSAIVLAYQNMADVRRVVPKLLYGELQFEGCLPISAGNYNEGLSMKAQRKPKYSPYSELQKAGMDVKCFKAIDSIALNGIKEKAYPGCQILVAKGGKIVYNRCYGRQTYDANAPLMDTNTVYDLASVTKVSATNMAVMMLVDQGKIGLDDPLSRWLPYLKHTNKSKITVRQALSHCARLKAYDSYWKDATTGNDLYRGDNPPEGYVAIGDKVYIKSSYRADLLKQIAKSDLQKKAGYVYSDLGFILLGDLVQQVSGQSLDIFMEKNFYKPLGMRNTTFQPLQHGININRIAPTEVESNFRNQLIRGYVHDPNAAAMGGVSGHAGLFSTGNDLVKLYQMMLDKGKAGNKQYVSAKTFDTFNSRHFADKSNRRALGFDKPAISGKSSHVSNYASQSSFGHTGFTGIMVWVDPKYDLIYIFLSNRVHPSASPNKLSSMNIRTDIQELIYKSFLK